MTISTRIATNDTTIVEDAEIGALVFSNNENILLLPVQLAISFPELEFYFASKCSIKTIAKINFKGLRAVTLLDLKDNQIEMISSDTFEDLTSLQEIQLGR